MSTTVQASTITPEQVAFFIERASQVRTSLTLSARDDGKKNTIRLKPFQDFTDDGDDNGEGVDILVNGKEGFGRLHLVEDPENPNDDMLSGSCLGFDLVVSWRKADEVCGALANTLVSTLDGEWAFKGCN